MRRLQVLVVDDSAVVRQAMIGILTREPGLSVSVASDPLIALSKMERARPDVIVLDLEMPRMDGFTFLRKLMAEDPIPVVVCAGLAERGTDAALRATEEGAVAVVAKPRVGVGGFLEESAQMLIDTIRGAAEARPRSRGLSARTSSQPARARSTPSAGARNPDAILALGASTGGTEALREILEAMPADAPGIVIVQHMPPVFTRTFAERLDRCCRIEVKEAEPGDRVAQGRALVAPGDRHLSVQRGGGGYLVETADGPLVSRHRPSVDVLFHSVARAAGANAVGAILTGMGDDGARGLFAMRQAGARTLAQDEASCVVFGMPKEAIARGAVGDVLPLQRMAGALLEGNRERRSGPLSPGARRP
ncbi:MAG TPA: chemotaxis response regulator protein-glutamate methylesterase [Vicinamibacteria bacterium]|nr:chemotaxis response regulator protein-glutamate methylesterase [Vicinamibacteria bacterium]